MIKYLIILFSFFASFASAQGYKVGDLIIVNESVWSPSVIKLTDSVTTHRFQRNKPGGYYVAYFLFEADTTKEYQIEVKRKEIKQAVEIDIAPSSGIVFTGSWFHASVQKHFANTISFSNTVNSTASLTFTGSRIELYAEKLKTHGILQILIDNIIQATVDTYSSDLTKQYKQVVFAKNVTPGQHKITARVTGTKNAASSNTYVVLDYFKVTK